MLSSIMEGGANVISETVIAGVPVIASKIDGNVGLLGEDYPGYYPVKDTDALRALLQRAETDQGFLQQLNEQGAKRKHLLLLNVNAKSGKLCCTGYNLLQLAALLFVGANLFALHKCCSNNSNLQHANIPPAYCRVVYSSQQNCYRLRVITSWHYSADNRSILITQFTKFLSTIRSPIFGNAGK